MNEQHKTIEEINNILTQKKELLAQKEAEFKLLKAKKAEVKKSRLEKLTEEYKALKKMYDDLNGKINTYVEEVEAAENLNPPQKKEEEVPQLTNNPEKTKESEPSEIEKRNTFTTEDLRAVSKGTAFASKGKEVMDSTKIESSLSIGDKITFFAERERKGVWNGRHIIEEGTSLPWGLYGVLMDIKGWVRNDTNCEKDLKSQKKIDSDIENKLKDLNSRRFSEIASIMGDSSLTADKREKLIKGTNETYDLLEKAYKEGNL